MGASRIGATCAITGSVLLFVGTYLHPMGADPNQAVAAFTEYAADHLWVESHLTQLAGVSLMVAALLLLAQQLRMGSGTAWAEGCGRRSDCQSGRGGGAAGSGRDSSEAYGRRLDRGTGSAKGGSLSRRFRRPSN